jgi:hypothetical protein
MARESVAETDPERPETYPVYEHVAQVQLAGASRPTLVGVKRTGMDTYFPDGLILHHDLAGRLLRIARPNVQWRRGLSGRLIELRKRGPEMGGGLERRLLGAEEIDTAVDDAAARMRSLPAAGNADDSVVALVDLAARFDAQAARDDVARFRAVYHDVPILPPDQYSSLVLAATDGCRYNKCTFCDFYRDTTYRAKTPDEFRAHVQAALAYHGRGLALRRGIFLGQANALLGPQPWRENILRIVNEACELPPPHVTSVKSDWWQGSLRRFTGITSFLDAFVGVRISVEEFAVMRQLNLRQIIIGLESGADALLQSLKKPATAEQVLDTVRAAKAGGLRVGVVVLVGAGGERFFDDHVRETVNVVRAMALEPGDFVYLSPLVIGQNAPYRQIAEAEGLQALGPERLAEQAQRMREGLRAALSRRGPYVAHYEVEQFVY